jgi:hypothetical protein
MSTKIKIKRRLTGEAGPPTANSLFNGELAFNEVDGTMFYKKADSVKSIAGGGDFATLNTQQQIVGNKTFTNEIVLSSAVASTAVVTATGTEVATTEFVQNVFSVLDGTSPSICRYNIRNI